MLSPRLIDLIHLDLDGQATPDERFALEQELQREPEVRRIHDEMWAVNRILDDRTQIDPPENLRHQIAEQVSRHVRARQASIDHFGARPAKRLRVVQLGFALAAVLVVAFLLAPFLMKDVDPDQLQGTMAPRAGAETTSNRIPIAGHQIEGAIFTATDGRELVIRPELQSRVPGRLEVRFDPEQLQAISILGTRTSNQETGQIVVELGDDPPELRFIRQTDGAISLSLNISLNGGAETSMEIDFPVSTNFSKPKL